MIEKNTIQMAQVVLSKSVNSRTHLVSYADITNQVNVPVSKVREVANQICKVLLTIPIVDDVDITDDCFDIMLKRRTARV